jgi:FtsP/CotA-like multicopper oxidase with cupredoxin domain
VKKTVKVAPSKVIPKEPEKKQEQNEVKDMDMKKDTTKKMDKPMDNDKMIMDSVETDMADQIQSKVYVLPGKIIRYDLYVKDTIVNFTGKSKRAIAINGSIPGPALIFTEGDTAEIYLHNMLKEETSLHWHGVILLNQADGVPYLTTAKIRPGETHLYKFKIVQNGTYWYHSHSGLQEQSGMYGALIFKTREEAQMELTTVSHSSKPKNKLFNKEYTVVLSEWTDDNPMQVQRRLRTANDWFAIKKGSVQSYAEAIKEGHFTTKLTNEWKRMKAMDVSDVYYNRFLTNGKSENTITEFKAGDKIKLKVVNAGASSYFWLGYAGGKITVIGNDGNVMVPVEVDRLIIAPSETYDLIVTIPENMSYEFRATAEDRTGYSSLWLGVGHKMPAPTLPRLKYFEGMKMMNDMMNMNGTMNDMGMKMSNQMMDMNSVMYPEITGEPAETDTMQMDHSQNMSMKASSDIVTLSYDMLRSPVKTTLPDGPVRALNFSLTGNMNRYVWTLDNKTVKEADRILINKGEVLRVVITNNSMMRHPMHLHGHDFRVLNSQGEYSPLKNVIDIMPMETDTIEFAANQSGNWFFHCHILFHMMAGMGRVFTYTDSPVNPELPDAEKAYKMFRKHKDQNMYHLMVRAGIEYNGSDGEAMVSTNRSALKEMWHLGYHDMHGYESETILGRYLGVNQWWFPYIGFDYHYKKVEGDITKSSDYKNMFGQVSNKNDRQTFVVGVEYTLPWLVIADARIDGDGKLRFQLSREDVPVTKHLRFNVMGNTDKEYTVGFRYIVSKWFALSTHYDSDMGLGAGITITY